MSRENVEIIREGYDLFNRQDLEAWLEGMDPEVEVHETVLAPDEAVYHGVEGAMEWLVAGGQALGDVSFEPEEFMDAGDAVVVSVRVRGRGASSGATFEARIAHAFRLRDGKVIFVGSYRGLTSAKEAVGLSA